MSLCRSLGFAALHGNSCCIAFHVTSCAFLFHLSYLITVTTERHVAGEAI